MAELALKWFGDEIMKKAEAAVTKAILLCAADLQGKSVEQAPIDTGTLRGSCSVSDPEKKGYTTFVKVGYNEPYAIVQHERLDFRHPRGGKAKYLEDPFEENKGKYERYIGEAIRNALK